MKIAFLFSGQGAQYPGMGANLYNHYSESKAIFDQADQMLDWSVKEVCFGEASELIHQTRYTQGALFTTSVAAYQAVCSKGIKPEAVLGFSLGEYTALVASGILTFGEALQMVEKRAVYMEECANNTEGTMAAVIGLGTEAIERVCQEIRNEGNIVVLANDNCPGQVIISGTTDGIQKAMVLMKEAGAKRVLPIKVSGAFHSPLMQEAANHLEKQLEVAEFKEVQIPIVSNVTAAYMTSEEAKRLIPVQITTGVRFRESIEYLIAQGVDTFVEIGAKKTLSSFVNKINSDVSVYHIEDSESLEKVLESIGDTTC